MTISSTFIRLYHKTLTIVNISEPYAHTNNNNAILRLKPISSFYFFFVCRTFYLLLSNWLFLLFRYSARCMCDTAEFTLEHDTNNTRTAIQVAEWMLFGRHHGFYRDELGASTLDQHRNYISSPKKKKNKRKKTVHIHIDWFDLILYSKRVTKVLLLFSFASLDILTSDNVNLFFLLQW